jgi:penicillin-binding protein-related factor A (putative recombinase)
MKKEADIQKEIIQYLWDLGIFCWRNNTLGVFDPMKGKYRKPSKYEILGVSDILGLYKGQFLAIEVKSAKGKLTDNQKDFLQKVEENGGRAFVARSIQEVEDNL